MATTENVGLMRYKDAAGNEYILYPVTKTSGIIADGPLDMDGQKVTNLPTPTEAGDAASKQYADTRAVRNLLDNSDFQNPVNQRMVTQAATTGYFIDRWLFVSGNNESVVNVQYGDVRFYNPKKGEYCEIIQRLENDEKLIGKTMTFAACVDGQVMILNFTFGTNSAVAYDGKIELVHFDKCLRIKNIANGVWITVSWAALYEGEYTAENLPPYMPKGYGAELAECMRYFFKETQALDSCAYRPSQSSFSFTYYFPVAMRILPTITTFQFGTSSLPLIFPINKNGVMFYDTSDVWAISGFEASADL